MKNRRDCHDGYRVIHLINDSVVANPDPVVAKTDQLHGPGRMWIFSESPNVRVESSLHVGREATKLAKGWASDLDRVSQLTRAAQLGLYQLPGNRAMESDIFHRVTRGLAIQHVFQLINQLPS